MVSTRSRPNAEPRAFLVEVRFSLDRRAWGDGDMERTQNMSARMRRPLLARLGGWLRRVVRNEQRADPEWDEEVRREQTGKMGEDIRLPEDIRASER
jgi:hypothetical protein